MKRKTIVFCVILLVLILAFNVSSALAFSGTGARDYANRWATARNSNYPNFGSDCTNFVSQALHSGGGYPYTNYGSYNSNAWWVSWNGLWFSYTNSWSVTNSLRTFLILDYPGGWDWGFQPVQPSNQALYGDVFFYDWQGDGSYEHASMEVAYSGTDANSGWSGNLIDQHTTDRYHAIWHLWPYNSNRYTTKIDLIHVDSGN